MPDNPPISLRWSNPAWLAELHAYRERHGLQTLSDVFEHSFARANKLDRRKTPDRARAEGRPIGHRPSPKNNPENKSDSP